MSDSIICLLLHLQILERSTCKAVQEFRSHSSRVKWCAFTKCSQLLVSVSEDCTAKVIIIVFMNESTLISFVLLWYILLAYRALKWELGRGYVKRGVGTWKKRGWVGNEMVGGRSSEKKEGSTKENGKDYGIF